MTDSRISASGNDDLMFYDGPDPDPRSGDELPPWKIIIADDQEEIHSVTKLVLDDFSFMDRHLQFISAYTGEETKKIIKENPDTAFILLDVVMETDHAGLDVVRFVRDELRNDIVQIVLNTGQPGQAPEHEVITKYKINDYKSKTEFNARKLRTSITSSLRAYSLAQNLFRANVKLNHYRNHLEELVEERTAEIEKTNKKLKLEIDERKRVEEALRQSNEIQANILSASPIGICFINNGMIEWVNEAMVAMFGFKRAEDYKGKKTRSLYPSTEEYERVKRIVLENLREGRPVAEDTVFLRKDGTTFFGNLKMSAMRLSENKKQSILTVSDITWRKKAEQDRIQKERLQGALEMSGSICHELNQPLQYVSGATELILMDMEEKDPGFSMLKKMKSQIDRMGSITKKLMGITSYKTRNYVGGRQIIDIERSSEDND